jgi:hypothetical protein
MQVLVVSTVLDGGKFWSGLKNAHASVDGVREFFESHAGAYATTQYFEADAANAVGLPR